MAKKIKVEEAAAYKEYPRLLVENPSCNGYNESKHIDINEEFRNSFIEGAKWQEKRMYSEEEVQLILDKTLIEYSDIVLTDIPHWFKKFKKK